MVDLSSYEAFARHLSTLKETSLDCRDGKAVYMTESSLCAVNFDDVKNEYVQNLHLSEIPKSNDALFVCGDTLLFAEFKNGYIDRAKQFEIRKKIYDSLFIFTDITSLRISDLRKMMEYILVYNETANAGNKELSPKNEVQPSVSFNQIAQTLRGYAQKEYVCFGLLRYQNYCFKAVHTYTQAEFEAYLTQLLHA